MTMKSNQFEDSKVKATTAAYITRLAGVFEKKAGRHWLRFCNQRPCQQCGCLRVACTIRKAVAQTFESECGGGNCGAE